MSRRVVISGTAYSPIARHADVPVGLLAVRAARDALAEAGLAPEDVDGLANYPGAGHVGAGSVDGVDFVGSRFMGLMLPATNLRWVGHVEPGDFASAIVAGVQAIAAGTCEVVLVWRAMHNPRNVRYGVVAAPQAVGDLEFTAPYGIGDALSKYAMPYSRYLAKYGARRAHMATFVEVNRGNAAINPDAVFHGKPVTREEYLASPMLVDPLSLLDCDMPIDGAGAVVLTAHGRAEGALHPPVHVSGYASLNLYRGNPSCIVLEDHEAGAAAMADALWASTSLKVTDVDTANLYDGFTYFTYLYLEALGFCGRGEAFEFIQDGRIARTGTLPLNTSGGSLGVGRLHGVPQVIESVRQIQGRCGARQLPRAEVALAVVGQPQYSGGYLLLSQNGVDTPRQREEVR